ncbi:MAG: stage III sporulation protein AF [Clostridiales bacterium]|nr:stage III sporulation protein AF [Clostridiales bacterium]
MIQTLYDWMKNIIVFMILTTVILNLLGKSNYKKYVGLITGLILVLLVIRPILTLVGKAEYMDFSLESLESLSDAQDFEHEIFAMEEQREVDILSEYRKVIMKQTNKLIGEKGLEVVTMAIDVEEDKSSIEFGNIRSMTLVTRYKTSMDMPGKTGEISKVEKVEIGQIVLGQDGTNLKESQQNSLSPMEVSIKKLLSDFYNIENNNINITIQEDRDE